MNTKFNRSDYIVLAVFFSISGLINFLDYYSNNNKLLEYIIDIPAATIMGFLGVYIFMYLLIPKFLVNSKQYFLFVVFGLLALVVIGGIEWTLGYYSVGADFSKFPSVGQFVFNSIYSASDSIGFPLGVLLTKKFYESQTQLAKVQEEQKENELKLLRSQIDPHFLFNNLNTLDSLIDSDSNKAKEYINRLSLIYRYLIQTKDAEVMELSKEIQFAENYIFLIETRFGTDYHFNIKINADIEQKFIPTGALQTLLENVVKHNKAGVKNITTEITIADTWLTVKNNKTNNPNKDSLCTGLQNLQTRYELLSDKKVDIKDANTQFVVSIPIIQLSHEN